MAFKLCPDFQIQADIFSKLIPEISNATTLTQEREGWLTWGHQACPGYNYHMDLHVIAPATSR